MVVAVGRVLAKARHHGQAPSLTCGLPGLTIHRRDHWASILRRGPGQVAVQDPTAFHEVDYNAPAPG